MPKGSRSKSAPDTVALLATAVAALDRDKAIARSSLGPSGVRDELIETLRRRGYEVGPKFVRVSIANQLEEALRDGSFIALKTLGAHVRRATAAEARKAALLLVDKGRAHLALRTNSETLVPATADVVEGKELATTAARTADLAKYLQKAARKKGASVLRSDVRELLERALADRPPSSPKKADPGLELPRILRAVERAQDANLGLSFVPKVVALMAPDLDRDAAKAALLEAAARGLLELRPESGLGRLSEAERLACPEGPQGTRLSWARRMGASA
jgi:hypothetical protein